MTKGKGFIRLTNELVLSAKWRSTPLAARAILLDLWARHDGKNNGAIPYSYRSAQVAAGCSPNTAGRALKHLQELGWIEPVQRGGFQWKAGAKQGRATTWRIKLERGGEKSRRSKNDE